MSPRRLAAAIVFLVAVFGSRVARAEDPCPCPAAPPPPPPLWFGTAEFSYVGTSGNTDTSSLGGALELNYKPTPWLFTLKAAYLHAATDGITTAESFAGGLKASRDLTERLDVFGAALYYRNTFAGIDSRYGGEAGAGYKIVKEKTLSLRVQAGFGYTHESRVDATSLDYPTGQAGFQFGWKFSKSAEFTQEFRWTDNLDNTTDWYLASVTAITADLTKILALKASYTYLYDNVPVPGFKKRDTLTSVAVVAKF